MKCCISFLSVPPPPPLTLPFSPITLSCSQKSDWKRRVGNQPLFFPFLFSLFFFFLVFFPPPFFFARSPPPLLNMSPSKVPLKWYLQHRSVSLWHIWNINKFMVFSINFTFSYCFHPLWGTFCPVFCTLCKMCIEICNDLCTNILAILKKNHQIYVDQ